MVSNPFRHFDPYMPFQRPSVPAGQALLFFISFCFSLLFSGCETDYPWSLSESPSQTIVVDGLITNELKSHQISLTLSNYTANQLSAPVSGATVVVTGNNKTYVFAESPSFPGNYYSAPFQAVIGKKYVLSVTYLQQQFLASDSAAAVTELSAYDKSILPHDSLFTYSHIKDGAPAMIDLYLDWSGNSSYTKLYGAAKAKETFYTLTNVDLNDVLAPDKETISFPSGTKLLRYKYSLSPIHQIFIRSLLMETEWRGGLFDVQQGNVTTNLTNGAKGFFGVCMTIKDSLTIN